MKMLIDWYDYSWFVFGRLISPLILLTLITVFVILLKQLAYSTTCIVGEYKCEKSLIAVLRADK